MGNPDAPQKRNSPHHLPFIFRLSSSARTTMKIFAKRKPKIAEESNTGGPRRISKTDKRIEELLQKDPSTLNAKQRRLVKRHQQRNSKSSDDAAAAAAEPVHGVSDGKSDEKEIDDPLQQGNITKRIASSSSSSSVAATDDIINGDGEDESNQNETQHMSSVDLIDTKKNRLFDERLSILLEQLNAEQRRKLMRQLERGKDAKLIEQEAETLLVGQQQQQQTSVQAPLACVKSFPKDVNGLREESNEKETKWLPDKSIETGSIDESLDKLLHQLNSKQRRKLMRRLERGEDAKNIEREAEILLEEKRQTPVVEAPLGEEKKASRKRNEPENAPTVPRTDSKRGRQSKRPRKSGVDWSSLPAKECLRREEQRRLQKEAEERRAAGEISAHRHPLNSERRRVSLLPPSS